MAVNNFDYEKFLKLAAKDYVLEELDDNSSTYKRLFESSVEGFIEKKEILRKLDEKKIIAETELNSEKNLLRALQDRRLKMDEVIKKQCDEINAMEKERDETVENYMKTVDNLHDKLTSIKNEFNPDTLRQQIVELKQLEMEIENDMSDLIQEKRTLAERMQKLKKEFPNFEALREIRDKIFCENKELEERRRELDNIDKFINDLKLK